MSDDWKKDYPCYLKTCAYPGPRMEYRCNDEAGLGFPSHCPCTCHKESDDAAKLKENYDGDQQ